MIILRTNFLGTICMQSWHGPCINVSAGSLAMNDWLDNRRQRTYAWCIYLYILLHECWETMAAWSTESRHVALVDYTHTAQTQSDMCTRTPPLNVPYVYLPVTDYHASSHDVMILLHVHHRARGLILSCRQLTSGWPPCMNQKWQKIDVKHMSR